VTTGAPVLAITSPLFPRVTIAEGGGHTLTVVGRHTPDTYIARVSLAIGSGHLTSWNEASIPAAALRQGATLTVGLSRSPNMRWGASASAAPRSYRQGSAPAVGFTTPGGALTMRADGSATLQLGVQKESAAGPAPTVTWHVVPPAGVLGVRVSPPPPRAPSRCTAAAPPRRCR
jgi:hypothetical protein